MAYALLGIPLMLLFLANIGDVMADIFRFVYSKVSENYHAKGRIGREGGGGGRDTTALPFCATPDSKIRGGG